jgi:beta-ureidopropionase / N-carbamoyl-L-amino-acid hydrolase
MTQPAVAHASFDSLWAGLLPIGRAASTGGYRRYAWNAADLACREWFADAAQARSMDVVADRNHNLWAWWLPAGWSGDPSEAFVTGSHLDSVPDGGAYDGPLGVASAFAAVDALRAAGTELAKPLAVACFADEEGARFGLSCVGSRLAAGALDPDRARALTDADGVTLAQALTAAGRDPGTLGRDDEALARVGVFVELHVEQGRALVELGAPLALASAVWPHGRWRFTFDGEPNHAGTTRLADRHDPMLTYASAVLAARAEAERAQAQRGPALATFGKVQAEPGATNGIAARVRAWLDARAADQATLDALVDALTAAALGAARADGTTVEVVSESLTPQVAFAVEPRERLAGVLGDIPVLATGAGHDAGILSKRVPAAMIFVRNPTGVSHSPAEHAEAADCHAGVDALAAAMTDWSAAK